MSNPLVNLSVVVPAGTTGIVVDVAGKYVKIVSCTAASVLMGFDAGNAERVYPDDCYAGPITGFKHLRFVADVGACTTVIQVSEQPVLSGSVVSLAVVAAILGSIDTDLDQLKAATAKTGGRSGAIAQSGVGTTAILAANANRKSGFVQASIDNAGRVWLGTTNAVTQATSWCELMPGATSSQLHDTVAVWACSENGTETVHYHETT